MWMLSRVLSRLGHLGMCRSSSWRAGQEPTDRYNRGVPTTSCRRRAFDRIERAVGGPLERAVQTRAFADAVVVSVKVRRSLLDAFERNTRMVLHAWNVPARTDVDRLNGQVAALRHELREFIVRFDDAAQG